MEARRRKNDGDDDDAGDDDEEGLGGGQVELVCGRGHQDNEFKYYYYHYLINMRLYQIT